MQAPSSTPPIRSRPQSASAASPDANALPPPDPALSALPVLPHHRPRSAIAPLPHGNNRVAPEYSSSSSSALSEPAAAHRHAASGASASSQSTSSRSGLLSRLPAMPGAQSTQSTQAQSTQAASTVADRARPSPASPAAPAATGLALGDPRALQSPADAARSAAASMAAAAAAAPLAAPPAAGAAGDAPKGIAEVAGDVPKSIAEAADGAPKGMIKRSWLHGKASLLRGVVGATESVTGRRVSSRDSNEAPHDSTEAATHATTSATTIAPQLQQQSVSPAAGSSALPAWDALPPSRVSVDSGRQSFRDSTSGRCADSAVCAAVQAPQGSLLAGGLL